MIGFQTQWLLYKLIGLSKPFEDRFEKEVRAVLPMGHRLTRNGCIWIQSDPAGPINLWMPWWARPRWWFMKLYVRWEDP